MSIRIEARESRSKNMYARVKEDNFKWIHQAAKGAKRSLSDYVDTLIEQLRADAPKRQATNGAGKKRTKRPAVRTARKSKRTRARH